MGAFGATSSTVIMGFSARTNIFHSNACTQLYINSLIHTQNTHVSAHNRAVSFMSLKGKRNKESLSLLQWCTVSANGQKPKYTWLWSTLCNSPFTMYGLSARELPLGYRRTKEEVRGCVCFLCWWHRGAFVPLKWWDCRWYHSGRILRCSRWINSGGGWGKCVCGCVCKSAVLMLLSIFGSRHAWLCVWTCMCMCVYVCISHQSRGKPVCKVICMLMAEQQSYSPRGYKPRWMWNKQLLLPKATLLVSMCGPNEDRQN